VQGDQGGIPLGCTVGLQDFYIRHHPIAVLHQHVAAVAQFGFFARPLARQQGIRIGCRNMRLVLPLLSMEVYRRIAWIIYWRFVFAVLLLETLQARARFQQGSRATGKQSPPEINAQRGCRQLPRYAQVRARPLRPQPRPWSGRAASPGDDRVSAACPDSHRRKSAGAVIRIPMEPQSAGGHLRRKRLGLQLPQRDVGLLCGRVSNGRCAIPSSSPGAMIAIECN